MLCKESVVLEKARESERLSKRTNCKSILVYDVCLEAAIKARFHATIDRHLEPQIKSVCVCALI